MPNLGPDCAGRTTPLHISQDHVAAGSGSSGLNETPCPPVALPASTAV